MVEKTKAELAWLEQQKKHIKSKGADDAYPRLKQKERGIIRRLKQEQAELKRLQEVQRAASRQRLMMLKESQEIVKMQKSAQRVCVICRSTLYCVCVLLVAISRYIGTLLCYS